MQLRVNLFRQFQVFDGQDCLDCFNTLRVQELFSFLLLNRQRPHRREALIETLWGEQTPKQAKKYLRQLLWQLRTAVQDQDPAGEYALVTADEEWISLCPQAQVSLDVREFEQAYRLTQDVDGAELDARKAQALQSAVKLYTGDLLEGWYQDWCVFERERLQNIYLLMLDKLIAYAEAHSLFEEGIQYGMRALRCDQAREITYQRLMRLHYLAGDRTGALRYYARCVESLRTELEVEPTAQTQALHEEICADRSPRLPHAAAPQANGSVTESHRPENLMELLNSCIALNQALKAAQEYNEQNIQLLVAKLSDPPSSVS